MLNRFTAQADMQRPASYQHAGQQQTALPSFHWHPLPLVIETEGDSAWAAWDHAVREQDRKTPDGRAAALAAA